MRICILLLASIPAFAACSGSGVAWTCTAGSTVANVQSALNSATDGAVITFAAGSYSWASWAEFSNSKGATLICASVGACNVTVSAVILGLNGSLSGTNNHLYRISGFTFTGSNGFIIWFYGAGTLTQVRIDHNTFTSPTLDDTLVFFGENSTVANFAGLMDHNTVTASGNVSLLEMIGAQNNSPPSSPFGTANNIVVEDNTITITTMTNAGKGCVDGWNGGIVWRHNTTTNCLVTLHGTTHAGGPANMEFYSNTVIVNSGASAAGFGDGYRLFHHQGAGELIAFNNLFTAFSGKNSNALEVTHYRSSLPSSLGFSDPPGQCDGTHTSNPADGNRSTTVTNRGYPCFRQPGRDQAANLKPMYAWNNKWSDTNGLVPLVPENVGSAPIYFTNHIVSDRDLFNSIGNAQTSATSPFNGTTGMGFGTLANRPTTCSVGGTQAADAGQGGVGYFATDVGTQGTLYGCSASNTWTVRYEPYTYPHPLQGSASTGPTRSVCGTGLSLLCR